MMKPFKFPSKEELMAEIEECNVEIKSAFKHSDYEYARQWQDKRRSAEIALARVLGENVKGSYHKWLGI